MDNDTQKNHDGASPAGQVPSPSTTPNPSSTNLFESNPPSEAQSGSQSPTGLKRKRSIPENASREDPIPHPQIAQFQTTQLSTPQAQAQAQAQAALSHAYRPPPVHAPSYHDPEQRDIPIDPALMGGMEPEAHNGAVAAPYSPIQSPQNFNPVVGAPVSGMNGFSYPAPQSYAAPAVTYAPTPVDSQFGAFQATSPRKRPVNNPGAEVPSPLMVLFSEEEIRNVQKRLRRGKTWLPGHTTLKNELMRLGRHIPPHLDFVVPATPGFSQTTQYDPYAHQAPAPPPPPPQGFNRYGQAQYNQNYDPSLFQAQGAPEGFSYGYQQPQRPNGYGFPQDPNRPPVATSFTPDTPPQQGTNLFLNDDKHSPRQDAAMLASLYTHAPVNQVNRSQAEDATEGAKGKGKLQLGVHEDKESESALEGPPPKKRRRGRKAPSPTPPPVDEEEGDEELDEDQDEGDSEDEFDEEAEDFAPSRSARRQPARAGTRRSLRSSDNTPSKSTTKTPTTSTRKRRVAAATATAPTPTSRRSGARASTRVQTAQGGSSEDKKSTRSARSAPEPAPASASAAARGPAKRPRKKERAPRAIRVDPRDPVVNVVNASEMTAFIAQTIAQQRLSAKPKYVACTFMLASSYVHPADTTSPATALESIWAVKNINDRRNAQKGLSLRILDMVTATDGFEYIPRRTTKNDQFYQLTYVCKRSVEAARKEMDPERNIECRGFCTVGWRENEKELQVLWGHRWHDNSGHAFVTTSGGDEDDGEDYDEE